MSPRNKNKIKSINKIEFNWRFRTPGKQQISNALKVVLKNNEKLKKSVSTNDDLFEKLTNHFPSLPDPKHEMDWLVQFHELEQSCTSFLKEAPLLECKNKFIYYVQMGSFDKTNLNFADLFNYSQAFFGRDCVRLMHGIVKIIVKDKSITAEYNNKSRKLVARFSQNKYQIQAQSVFNLLKRIRPLDSYCLIAFTDDDLYVENSDLFVAGLCNGEMRVGTFSCYRYNPKLKFSEENWFETKLSKSKKTEEKINYNLLLTRSSKLLVHETCHLLGISHCVYFDCCMNGSGHLDEDFRQSMFLCPIDLKKLWVIFKFDIKQRYHDMKNFFQKHECEEELLKLEHIINSI